MIPRYEESMHGRYVHRVGRTARMGLKGEAILFLLPSEVAYLEWLSKCGCKVKEMAFADSVKDLPHLPIESVSSCIPAYIPRANNLNIYNRVRMSINQQSTAQN